MRLPLILIASACLFTSCQRPSAAEAGYRDAVDNYYYAMGFDKHKITAFHAGEEDAQGILVMRVLQTTTDLAGDGKTLDDVWHCDYSDGKHFYVHSPN